MTSIRVVETNGLISNSTPSYALTFPPDRPFAYVSDADGNRLAEVNYFGGYTSAFLRWGAGWFSSGKHFTQDVNPEPTSAERHVFSPHASARIDLMGVPLPGKGDWFFTPPPLRSISA